MVYSEVGSATDRAARFGVLNPIRREVDGRLAGDATDGLAMVSAIEERGGLIQGRPAMILGAGGGAGRAIADALCGRGISCLGLSDLDPTRLRNAKSGIADNWPQVSLTAVDSKVDILVNASTVGQAETDACPFELHQIRDAGVLCDVNNRHGQTSFVNAANKPGKLAISGAETGAAQLKPQLSFLGLGTGQDPKSPAWAVPKSRASRAIEPNPGNRDRTRRVARRIRSSPFNLADPCCSSGIPSTHAATVAKDPVSRLSACLEYCQLEIPNDENQGREPGR